MLKQVFWIGALLVIVACSNSVEDLKSPCAGADGNPCDRRPVNIDSL